MRYIALRQVRKNKNDSFKTANHYVFSAKTEEEAKKIDKRIYAWWDSQKEKDDLVDYWTIPLKSFIKTHEGTFKMFLRGEKMLEEFKEVMKKEGKK